jgi:two-component system cell cycle sensor histidine kinase/response regulator CckA
VAVLRDISAHRRVERELAERQKQMIQAQKIEAVGCLAGGIAHDFNNMLSIIVGYASMIQSGSSSSRQHAERILQTTERATRLTRQLLVFSRNQIMQPRVWSLNRLVRESIELFGRLIPEDIELRIELCKEAGNVKVDRVQMEQVLVNLLINSRDAMPNGGKITIQTGKGKPGRMITGSGQDGQPQALLRVTDTGCGMTPEVKARVFEPFFTTKDPGVGTGLGLSTVYGIVTQSGGMIRLESELNKGTRAEILLPMSKEYEEEETEEVRYGAATCQNTETILFVEDEKALREMLCLILRQNGYRVLEARSGKDALRLVKGHRGPINALITDLVMPEMNGIELAEEMMRLRPMLPVIYVSGYSDHAFPHGPLTECLEKPFAPEVLLSALRNILDESKAMTGTKAKAEAEVT